MGNKINKNYFIIFIYFIPHSSLCTLRGLRGLLAKTCRAAMPTYSPLVTGHSSLVTRHWSLVTGMDEQPLEVEIIRSAGRSKTASARWATPGRKVVVRVPASLDPAEEERLVNSLVARMQAGARRRTLNSDQALAARAAALNHKYFGD